MPTYDYKCASCGHAFEEFQSITAPSLVDCPQCGKPTLKRLMAGGAGMIFKGSGFYQTDYAKSGGGGGKKGSEPKKTDSPATDSKSDTPVSKSKEGTQKSEGAKDSGGA